MLNLLLPKLIFPSTPLGFLYIKFAFQYLPQTLQDGVKSFMDNKNCVMDFPTHTMHLESTALPSPQLCKSIGKTLGQKLKTPKSFAQPFLGTETRKIALRCLSKNPLPKKIHFDCQLIFITKRHGKSIQTQSYIPKKEARFQDKPSNPMVKRQVLKERPCLRPCFISLSLDIHTLSTLSLLIQFPLCWQSYEKKMFQFLSLSLNHDLTIDFLKHDLLTKSLQRD